MPNESLALEWFYMTFHKSERDLKKSDSQRGVAKYDNKPRYRSSKHHTSGNHKYHDDRNYHDDCYHD